MNSPREASPPVIRTEQFRADVDRYSDVYPRLEEAIQGVEIALRNNPQVGPVRFADFGHRSIGLESFPGVPKAHVYYEAAKRETRLLYLQVVEPEDG